MKNASGLPVFFWIHGGGFTSGSGNQYGVSDLVKKDIVIVTFNYRLGTLGELQFFFKSGVLSPLLFRPQKVF